MKNRQTLISHLSSSPLDTASDLNKLIVKISDACITIQQKIAMGALSNLLGTTGANNVQNEEVKKLDMYANNLLIDALTQTQLVSGIVSEENENEIIIDNSKSNFIVMMDPLDGSSNIDVNVGIGSIFSIYRQKNKQITKNDFLQSGKSQIAALYIAYGPSTNLVLTKGNGVSIYTLNPIDSIFYLTNENITTPTKGNIYSINEAYNKSYQSAINNYLSFIKDQKGTTQRYIGSMVSDFHRNLLKGGIFIYPGTKANPKGKLRLMYECNPLAFIAEQANGKATTNGESTLDIKPDHIHQREEVTLGSKEMVNNFIYFCVINGLLKAS